MNVGLIAAHPALSTITAREYLRVSEDRSGYGKSPDQQHNENLAIAERRNVVFREPYEDRVSASRYSNKVRDDFVNLLDDLRTGAFNAEELWIWESSRGSRKVGEWVELIDLCEKAHVVIYVTTHGRVYDPSNARDRRSLLEDAVDSAYESDKISTRTKRDAAANAARGMPHGPTPFGYVRQYNERRQLVAQVAHPEEAPIVRELFTLLTQGRSLKSVAEEFADKGYRNDKGTAFSAQHLRTLALTPTYAGWRVHDPEGRKGRRHTPKLGHGEWTDGQWERLVDRETWLAVYGTLTDPERVTTNPGGARHLASMFTKCGECGSPLSVKLKHAHKSGQPCTSRCAQTYVCHGKGACVRCYQEELDEFVADVVIRYLSRSDNFDSMEQGKNDDDVLRNLRVELTTARLELDELYIQAGTGGLSVKALAAIEPAKLARIAELEEMERALNAPAKLRGLISPGEHVQEQWNTAPIDTRREICRVVLSSEHLGILTVNRCDARRGGKRVPIRERVTLSA